MREREVERYLVDYVKKNGGQTRKVRWIGRAGAPDRYVIFRGIGGKWVEVKAPCGELSPVQVREHIMFREHNIEVYTFYTKKQVEMAVDHWARLSNTHVQTRLYREKEARNAQ